MTLPAGRYYDSLTASTATLAALVTGTDLALPIPACPDWTLRQLVTHTGRAHRWAAEISKTRSARFIEFRAVPDGKPPADQAGAARWLTDGAALLVTVLREAGDEPVWTPRGLLPASFWGRRMAHETTVHCADAQLAAGQQPDIPAELAADAVDEWLTTMSGSFGGEPDPRLDALPAGRTLHVHVTGDLPPGAGEWLVGQAGGAIEVRAGHAKADVALAGPAAVVLLVLMRRLPPGDPRVAVHGDAALLDSWLERTAF